MRQHLFFKALLGASLAAGIMLVPSDALAQRRTPSHAGGGGGGHVSTGPTSRGGPVYGGSRVVVTRPYYYRSYYRPYYYDPFFWGSYGWGWGYGVGLGYGYGINAIRSSGRGAQSILFVLQFDWGRTRHRLVNPNDDVGRTRGLDTIFRNIFK